MPRFEARVRSDRHTEAYIVQLAEIERERLALRRDQLNQFNKVERDLLEMDSARWTEWKTRILKLMIDCRKNDLRGANEIAKAAARLGLKSLGGMRLTARHIDILRREYAEEIRSLDRAARQTGLRSRHNG